MTVEKDKMEWFFGLNNKFKINEKPVNLTESFMKFTEDVASIEMEEGETLGGFERIHWIWSNKDVSLLAV